MSLQCCWNLVIQIFFLPIVYPMHVTLVLSIAESSKIVNLKHAAKPQELANWDAIAIAQSLAKQKHTASIILFSGSSWKAQHSMNITCILSHFRIFFWCPQIVWYFLLQLALYFHCKYSVQNGLEFGVQVFLCLHRNCLRSISRNGEIHQNCFGEQWKSKVGCLEMLFWFNVKCKPTTWKMLDKW